MDAEHQPFLRQIDERSSSGVNGGPFPIVGIGASAGSLPALQRFFAHTAPNTGMAFVVIVHQAPKQHELAALLAHETAMPVHEVGPPLLIAPDQIYLVPFGEYVMIEDGTIFAVPFHGATNQWAPIDLFFRALAEAHDGHAVAVILSGNGRDGASGLQRIKERGGVTFVQEPHEAECDGMPRAAIASKLVDFVLPVAAIPDAIRGYWRNGDALQLPDGDAGGAEPDEVVLHDIFALMLQGTGHNFSQYKRGTLLRRIARRMQVTSVVSLPAYLHVLRTRPEEVQAFLRDLLISVTNFFRDATAWRALEAVIPQLIAGKSDGDQVRVWVVGCASGEEAYTVAMLLLNYASRLADPPTIQVFATDIDESAIARARAGVFPLTIAADIPLLLLERFFVREQHQYRVTPELREAVLFAVQNVLRDPPFSRLALITCRNLLIYLNQAAQEQVLNLFHLGLHTNGYLLLGASETVDAASYRFTTLDRMQRLYQRNAAQPVALDLFAEMPRVSVPRPTLPPLANKATSGPRSYSDLTAQLLAQYGPPSLIVDETHEIIHVGRGVGRFLQLGEGELSRNLLNLIHPNLRIELQIALFAATQHGTPTEISRVRMDVNGAARFVSLMVQPVGEPEWARGAVLVMFVDGGLADAANQEVASEVVVHHLEAEVQQLRDSIRLSTEQYKTVVEEYQASNEELQTTNEELRATSEELEISKEELQATNEELRSINQEYEYKIVEVNQSNDDLQNLMAATAIGTVFVDTDLHIMRYTPAALAIFNLISSDLHRPLTDVTHTLQYPELVDDVMHVLETIRPHERETHSRDNHWYLARFQPYRTGKDRITGVVLTFVDITEQKQAEAALQATHDTLETRVGERTAAVQEANARLQSLVGAVVRAQEDERQRIARELHDSLGQFLSALMVRLSNVQSQVEHLPAVRASLQETRQVARQIDEELDQLTMQLRPPALNDLGLEEALRDYVQAWTATSGLAVDMLVRGLDTTRLLAAVETTVYRIVQEALNNVLKHAQASHVSVIIERRGDELKVIVEDNGRGFDPDAIPKQSTGGRQVGVISMTERAALAGGTLSIESILGTGTTIYVHILLKPLIDTETHAVDA